MPMPGTAPRTRTPGLRPYPRLNPAGLPEVPKAIPQLTNAVTIRPYPTERPSTSGRVWSVRL